MPLPEIYYAVSASQWTVVRKYWDATHTPADYFFDGVTGETPAPSGGINATAAWNLLNSKNPGLVGPNLVCFGPAAERKGEHLMRTRTLRHSRKAKLLTALAVLGLAGAVSGLAAAGSSPVSTPRLGSNVTVPADKAAAMADRMPSAATDAALRPVAAAAAAFTPEPIPAGILGSNVPVPVPASVITETNGWLV